GISEDVATNRKARVTRLDVPSHVGLEVVFELEIDDIAARRHDNAHDAVAKIQHIHEQAEAEWRDFLGFLALVENQPQFRFAVHQFRAWHWLTTEHGLEKEIGRFVQRPNRGLEQNIKSAQWPDKPKRN